MMPRENRYAPRGQEALEELTNRVKQHWSHLPSADRHELKRLLNADSPEQVVKCVLGLINLVGTENVVSYEPATVEDRRRRLRQQSADHRVVGQFPLATEAVWHECCRRLYSAGPSLPAVQRG